MKPQTLRLLALLLILLLGGYWLLPISGQLFVLLDDQPLAEWPQVRLEPDPVVPGERAIVTISDTSPWVYVNLVVNEAIDARYLRSQQTPQGFEWSWSFAVPETLGELQLDFYHDCDQGCQRWHTRTFNTAVNVDRFLATQQPTKLGVVFANPNRNWHNRSGWVVDLTYTELEEEAFWGLDDVAKRVQTAVSQGQRVILRIDFSETQPLPPADDPEAIERFLTTVRKIARDERLADLYAISIGANFNTASAAITPEAYARLFNGFGTESTAQDNVLSIVRVENPSLRVLVGSVRPWEAGMDGERPFAISEPWLNYLHTLNQHLVTAASERAAAGISLMLPDGYALQASGNLSEFDTADEPQTDQRLPSGAQNGFRVYQDWLAVINATPETAGLPAYITSSNTFRNEDAPAQNYPSGWLTSALAEINDTPQIHALCWFVDSLPTDNQWDAFSLTLAQNEMAEAASEFNDLLQIEQP